MMAFSSVAVVANSLLLRNLGNSSGNSAAAGSPAGSGKASQPVAAGQ
jgi:hypothetical protein